MKIYAIIESIIDSDRVVAVFFIKTNAEKRISELIEFTSCLDVNTTFYIEELEIQDEPDTRLFE